MLTAMPQKVVRIITHNIYRTYKTTYAITDIYVRVTRCTKFVEFENGSRLAAGRCDNCSWLLDLESE